MTPTLLGRWQTRTLLLTLIGLPLTVPFALFYNSTLPFLLLFYVLCLGHVWDIAYDYAQKHRWDHDWPPTLQLAAGIVEMLLLAFLVWRILPVRPPTPFAFLAHYSTVWVATFIASQSAMRLFFPRWRFRGGKWI